MSNPIYFVERKTTYYDLDGKEMHPSFQQVFSTRNKDFALKHWKENKDTTYKKTGSKEELVIVEYRTNFN